MNKNQVSMPVMVGMIIVAVLIVVIVGVKVLGGGGSGATQTAPIKVNVAAPDNGDTKSDAPPIKVNIKP